MSKRGDRIHKRNDGRWEGRYKIGAYKNGNTKYKSVYGKTYTEAKTKLFEAQTLLGVNAEKNKDNKMLFSEILFRWMDNNRLKHKGATEHKYYYLIEKHIIPELGNIPISQIDATMLNAFLDNKASDGRLDKAGGLSYSYVKTIAFIIQSSMKFAAQERHCLPLNHNIIKPNVRKRELRILSVSEQRQFEVYLSAKIDNTRIAILICLHAGLRLGEICALKWNDVDLQSKVIHVRHTVSRVRDNSNETSSKTLLVIETPKTQSSARDIPISSILFSYLKEIKRTSDEHYILSGNSTFLSPRTLEYRFKKLVGECEITTINFHALRHTFATRCIEAGVDIKSLSEILGHANVGITLNTYVHSSMEMKHRQIEKLANYAF